MKPKIEIKFRRTESWYSLNLQVFINDEISTEIMTRVKPEHEKILEGKTFKVVEVE